MITVIVPFYNSAKWLGRCAESLHSQKGDFEFIFVDDFSADNGAEIIKQINDDRFILLDNEHNKGVSGARNTGIDHANGEWITFLDADDEMVPDAYVVFDRMTRLGEDANIIQANHLRHYEKINKTALKHTNPSGLYTFDNLPKQWCMVWNKLYRVSFVGDTRFVEDFQYGEDELFNLDLLAKDERIFHTKTKTVTILRHFDNKESLSHIKGRDEVLQQARALENFIFRTDNPRAKTAAMKVLSEHWGSPTYIGAFGGKL